MALWRFVSPLARVGRLAREAPPVSADAAGTVLFADVSGFTELMASQSAGGGSSVERLTESVNRCFSDLIELISARGGNVIGFAGDALLAHWPASGHGGLARSARLASGAALDLQRTLNRRDVGDGVRLTLRAAISTGPALSVVVPIAGRRAALLVGTAIEQMKPILAAAAPGEVTVGATTLPLLADSARTAPRPGGVAALHGLDIEGAPSAAATLLPDDADPWPYLSPVVRFWEQAGQPRFAAEFRTTTSVFVKLPRFDLNQGSELAAFSALVDRAAEICESRGGAVDKVIADEKGAALLLVWGLPTMAHEDAAQRAVYAALEVREAFAERGAPSVGIATGEVWCGVVGNSRRAEYTLLGASVNLAARLMVASDGRILICPATSERLRGRVQLEAPVVLELKGLAAPVPVRAVVGRVSTTAMRPIRPLVGRGKEQERLQELRRTVSRESKSAVLLIEAEPGAGKTTLLEAFVAAEGLSGRGAHWATASSEDHHAHYVSLRPLLRSALALPEGAEEAARQLRDRCGEESLLARLPLLGEALGVDLGTSELAAGLRGSPRADNLHSLVSALLLQRAGGGLTFVVDDVQWLDAASWALLRAIVRTVPALLLVLGVRSGSALGPDAQSLCDGPDVERLKLEPLGRSAIDEVVALRLGVEKIPPALGAFIAERCEGNPYIAEEVALSLRDVGQIVLRDGAVHLRDGTLEQVRLPSTIQGLVQARVDRLDADAQLLLKIGAVLGRSFELREVEALWPGAAPDLLAAATRAEQREIVRIHRRAKFPEVEFRHALASEAMYQSLLYAQRRDLHGAAVRYYEGRGDGVDRLGSLAHHAEAAEDWSRAVRYYDESGLNALQRGSNADCVRALLRAESLATARSVPVPARRQASWAAALSEASIRLGNVADELKYGLLALDRLESPIAVSPWGRAREVLSRILRRKFGGAPPEATAAPDHERTELLTRSYVRLIDAFGFVQDVFGFLASSLRLLDLAEASSRGALAAFARLYLYFFVIYFPAERLRTRWLVDVEAVSAGLPDDSIRARVLSLLCAARWGRGDWDEGEAHGREGLRASQAVGDLRIYCETSINIGHALSSRGKLRDAEWAFRAARDVARLTADVQAEGMASLCLTWVAIQGGQLVSDTDLHDAVADFFEKEGIAGNLIVCDGVRARVAAELDKRELAGTLVDRCAQRALAVPFPAPWSFHGIIAGWEASLLIGGPTMATRCRRFEKALRLYARTFPFAAPALDVLRIRTTAQLGRVDQALVSARRALREPWVSSIPVLHLNLRELLATRLQGSPEALEHRTAGERLRTEILGQGPQATPSSFRIRSIGLS